MDKQPSGGEIRLFRNSALHYGPGDWQRLYIEFTEKHDAEFRPFVGRVLAIIQQLEKDDDFTAIQNTLLSYAIENYRAGIPPDDITDKIQQTVNAYMEFQPPESD